MSLVNLTEPLPNVLARQNSNIAPPEWTGDRHPLFDVEISGISICGGCLAVKRGMGPQPGGYAHLMHEKLTAFSDPNVTLTDVALCSAIGSGQSFGSLTLVQYISTNSDCTGDIIETFVGNWELRLVCRGRGIRADIVARPAFVEGSSFVVAFQGSPYTLTPGHLFGLVPWRPAENLNKFSNFNDEDRTVVYTSDNFQIFGGYDHKIEDLDSGFLANGFVNGMKLNVAGSGSNEGDYIITDLTAESMSIQGILGPFDEFPAAAGTTLTGVKESVCAGRTVYESGISGAEGGTLSDFFIGFGGTIALTCSD